MSASVCAWCSQTFDGPGWLCGVCEKLDVPPQPGRNLLNMDAPDLRPVRCCSPHCDANPRWIGAADCRCFDMYYSINEDGTKSFFDRYGDPWKPEMGICNGPGSV